MRSLLGLFLCFGLSFATNTLSSVQGFFDPIKDGSKFKKIFQDGLLSQDLASIHYSTMGLGYLNEKIANSAEVCTKIKNSVKNDLNVEQSYYAANAAQKLSCKDALHPEILKTVMKTLEDSTASLPDLMHAVYTLKALGNKGYDKNTAIKTLQEYLKKDDSVNNLGLIFHICAEVECGSWASERIEDAIIQADEVDGKLLHWEGGLPVTASVLSGIIKLSQQEKKPTQITSEQSVKLANYLLSRRSVQTIKGGALLLEAITYLANDKSISPICITLKGNGQVGVPAEPIQITVSDLLGKVQPIDAASVIAQSVTRLSDDVVILSKQKLNKHSKEETVYTLDLMKEKPERGLYKLAVNAGNGFAVLPIRILGAVDIDNVEVGISDVDGSSSPRLNSVSYPNKLQQSLEADSLQKVIVKFSLKDKGQTKIAKAHQTFVRIFNKDGHEVIFVAELESLKIYKMEVDLGSVADKFNHNSGLYSVELIIGDAAISNPIRWILADVTLKFAVVPPGEGKVSPVVRDVKPEIVHMFREPDARPARIVSDVFTGLCIAPLLLLFILWANIGVNIRNFPFSLSALGFHIGFGSILGLFVVFWLRLTMFETIRYLLVLGLITFICGHRLLSNIATKRKRV